MRRSIAISLIIIVMAVLSAGCGGQPQAESLSVVASFYPLEYFSSRIIGDRGTVANLVEPGVEPHDFEPTADDLKLLTGADVLIHNGFGLEPWLDRALASIQRKDLIVVAAGEAIGPGSIRKIGDGAGSGADPHVWLNPLYAIRQVEAIRDALKKADPQGAELFDRNASKLIDDLNTLDAGFSASLQDCRLDFFVTAHAAFAYLAERYGLRQVGITGIEQEEPDPEQLARIVDAVREHRVKFVLTEPGASPKIAETVAREVGADVRELDPVEFITDGDYLTAMDRNRTVLREVLECRG